MARDDSLSLRRATIGDSEPLARGVIEGVEDYPSFAPPGWTPPRFEAELNHLRAALADPDVCCLVAVSEGALVGQRRAQMVQLGLEPRRGPARRRE